MTLSIGHKIYYGFCLVLLDHLFWEKPAAMLLGHSSTLWRDTCGKELTHSANNQHQPGLGVGFLESQSSSLSQAFR